MKNVWRFNNEKSKEDIINKSREYLSDNIDVLSIGGSCSDGDKTLFWLIDFVNIT